MMNQTFIEYFPVGSIVKITIKVNKKIIAYYFNANYLTWLVRATKVLYSLTL